MVKFDFVRSHGLGNDYLVVDPARLGFPMTPARAKLICDRHVGVGSDGVLEMTKPTRKADFSLKIWNPDGSEAEKSGNGLRIFAQFLYHHGYTKKTEFTVQTLGGLVYARLMVKKNRVIAARVDMGNAVINNNLTTLEVGGKKLKIVALSVGNPHCVTIVPDLAKVDFFRLGPLIENHKAFPNRTNVQFAQVRTRNAVRALIWERGAGHTLASGSSSCAVAAACHHKGHVDNHVTVEMEGGNLDIEIGDPSTPLRAGGLALTMTGPVEEICAGNLSEEIRRKLLGLSS